MLVFDRGKVLESARSFIRIEPAEVGQEGAGEVAVAKRNDSNERRWHPMMTKDEEGQLSDVTWPPMTYNGARC